MPQEIAPIAVRPSTLSGISEQMVVGHYEHDYGNALRTLNAVRLELATLDTGTPPYRLRGLKREELSLMGSVALHELYFANLGGFRAAGPNSGLGRPDWHEVPDADMMAGATWRDPDRVEEWIAELTLDKPVAVYCSYGFDVGRNVARTLRERGFDARFVRGGVSAWYALGGERAMRPPAG